jgi:hypothetical protein
MDFEKLKRKAQDMYTRRGGAEAAKGDATELRDILKGQGTLMDKAKRAAKALKEPGASHQPTGDPAGRREQPPEGPPGPQSSSQ